ncbi:SpaA isopeptide-forming pilin-related protein [Peptostreptococcus porci]|uniref:SpaA isopeptide-forming pilin-related protein n=1 Tax=Peptostreptococcus porci TaxID=2652282 RepID=UPI002A909C08|nr:SpaA isopeptide-forming pilin-related protein [Peptostreptococcus porci]MDY6231178.1 SpaA isopeptide-forming pilin-related protein [Peptostreptococcus porci]
MKRIKKIVTLFLAIILLFTSIPINSLLADDVIRTSIEGNYEVNRGAENNDESVDASNNDAIIKNGDENLDEPVAEMDVGQNLNKKLTYANYKFEPLAANGRGESSRFELSFEFNTVEGIKAGDFVTVDISKLLANREEIRDLKVSIDDKDISIAEGHYESESNQIKYIFNSEAEKLSSTETVKVSQIFDLNNNMSVEDIEIGDAKSIEIINIIFDIIEKTNIKIDDDEKVELPTVDRVTDKDALEENRSTVNNRFGLNRSLLSELDILDPMNYANSGNISEDFIRAFSTNTALSSFSAPMLSTRSTNVEATGDDVSGKITFTNNNPIGTYNRISITANTESDTYLLNLSFQFENSIKSGDYFAIRIPSVLSPQSIVKSSNVLDLKTKDGEVVAQAKYDENTRTITYVFTSYMDNHRNVKGTLKQPFNLNPYYVAAGERVYVGEFKVAGKYLNTTYSDYYYTNTNERADDNNGNTIFKSVVVDVDRDNKTFTQYIHLNPNGLGLYESSLTIRPTDENSSAVINKNTKVELYEAYYPYSLNIYSPAYLYSLNNMANLSVTNGAVNAYFGNYLYNNNRYVLKVTGSIDDLGKPISLSASFSTRNSQGYTGTFSKVTSYSNQLGSSEFSGDPLYKPVDFTIKKVNENGENLTGAKFKITSDTGKTWEIDGENLSNFEFKQLPKGHYTIEETKTPDGYKPPSTYWQFTINVDEQDQAFITSPDFPMEIKTDGNTRISGEFPDPYESLYSDLVRNPRDYEVEFKDDGYFSTRKGTISKRIIDRLSANTYKVEVMVKVDPNQTINSGKIEDQMGGVFNVDLGVDGGFAREDYSLTASDGSFLYIENPDSESFVSGGEPFAKDKILTGSKISYEKNTDKINVENLNFTTKDKGAWIKLTYNIKFDFDKADGLNKSTFYKIGDTSFSWLNNYSQRERQALASPSARPIIHGKQTEMAVTVINFKEDAKLEMKKVGEKRTYGSDGKFTTATVGLQGAQFELYKSSENNSTKAITTNKKFITNADGEILFQNIQRDFDDKKGNSRSTYYWLKELSSPNGYEKARDLIGPFRINYNGSVDYLGNDSNTVKKDNQDNKWQIENKRINHKGELDIFKRAGDETLDGGGNKPLKGSTFTLYWIGGTNDKVDPLSNWDKFWSSNEVSQTVTSEEDGRVFFKDLKEGYYRLEETKPSPGYVKANTIWQVYVDGEGITKITDVANKKSNENNIVKPAAITGSARRSLLRSLSSEFITDSFHKPMSLLGIMPASDLESVRAANVENSVTRESTGGNDSESGEYVNIQKIDSKYHKELYSAPDKEYKYTGEQDNFTGFKEKYINPTDTKGLYTFDGSYKSLALNEVAGVNKYIVPTGKPGEYTVHVRVKGNRTKSNLGVVIVYDNSNSMRNNINNVDRLSQANQAISNFTKQLVSTGNEETKVALVTYGSELFPEYSTYNESNPFTNNPEAIISKLPREIPSERGVSGLGGTYTQGAIEKAKELLKNESFDNKVILTVTDGVPTYSNLIKYIDENGKYVFDTTKTGTGNRFIQPYTYNSGGLTNYQQPEQAYYSDYWVEDRTKPYDNNADYAKTSFGEKYYYDKAQNRVINGNKYYFEYRGYGGNYSSTSYNYQGALYYNGYYYYKDTRGSYDLYTQALPNNGYGYKLIKNHGYATIESGGQIQKEGYQMYTLGIQIGSSNISGTQNPDATRLDALEVMFGISSSKDHYFDAQNLDYLDVYLKQILTELEEQNPPTVNNGKLIDPMGEMVTLAENEPIVTSIKDVGSKKIPIEIMNMISTSIKEMSYEKNGSTIKTKGIELGNLNIGKDQEIELTYKVHLNTENPKYVQGTMYETNGPTTLQPNGDYDKKWQLPIPKISGPMVPMELSKQWQKADGTVPEKTKPVQVQLQRKLVGQDDSEYKNVPEYDSLGRQIENPTPKEVNAPDWKIEYKNLIPFDKDGNVYEYRILEVNPDGAYTILYEGNGYSSTIINRERVKQDVINNINEISFVKKDSKNGKTLSNVKFQLLKNDESFVSEIHTDTEGKLEFKKLHPGSYKLVELHPPAGYKKPENPVREFVVGEDGVIRKKDGGEITEDFKTILNEPTIVEVVLKKIDGDSNLSLSGAKFRLYKDDENTEVEQNREYTSGQDGRIELGALRAGTYYLEEISAPSGYLPYKDKKRIIVQEDGKVLLSGSESLDVANYKEKTAEIGIKKVEKNSNGGLDALSGATFKIYKKDNDSYSEPNPYPEIYYKSGSHGVFKQLKEGEYKIVEERAPLGYVRFGGHYTFKVESTQDGNGKKTSFISWIKKYASDEDTTGTEIYNKGNSTKIDEIVDVEDGDEATSKAIGIQVVNSPNKLVFKKVDNSDDKKILAGVKFGLYYEVDENIKEVEGRLKNGKTLYLRSAKEGKLVGAENTDDLTPVTRTTNDEGKTVFDKMRQRYEKFPEIKYYIKEIEPKEGYQKPDYFMGPYIVNEDGIHGPDGKLITSDQEIEIENFKKPDLQITKIDANEKEKKLAGAEFELYKATKGENGSYLPVEEKDKVGEILTTDAQGVAKFERLEEGLYWIREVSAPLEYARIPEDIGPFLVEDDKIYKVELDDQGRIKTENPIIPFNDIGASQIKKELLKTAANASTTIPTYELDIENLKATYPQTGGIGSVPYIGLGLGVMLLAVYGLRKRKSDY